MCSCGRKDCKYCNGNEKEKQMKKTAKKKTRWESVVDLVDCHLDEEITQDELIEKLMTLIGKPIIKISEMEFVVNEWKGNVYLNSRSTFKDGMKDNWIDVSDLTELKVWEYNQLVDELNKHYPDYPIERLESRFV
tara:strand:- start:90 stop:494 length:405 start_codon:yes stop_codon:yes gene_type:complete